VTSEEKIEEAAAEEVTVAEEVTEEVEEVSELEALRQELEEAKAQAAEYLDGWQRARAEFANYKKRNEQERQELFKLANTTLITKLLPIFDDRRRSPHLSEAAGHPGSGRTDPHRDRRPELRPSAARGCHLRGERRARGRPDHR